jgi:phage terminase large subunit-like protein
LQSVAQRLASLSEAERAEVLSGLTEQQALEILYEWRGFNARPDQIAPPGDWDIWLALAGRGWGKTRTGSEWIREEVDAGRAKRIALIAETAADGRDVIVEGDSGILAVYPEAQRPLYEPSKRRLTWANGAVATLFNATEPDQLRGPQFDLAWCDELAKWKRARETWDMLQFGLRLGAKPRVLVTTTPRPIELVKAIVAGQEGRVAITRGSTMDNSINLAKSFLDKITQRYAGSRLGRQELDGEILGDIPNALWTYAMIDAARVKSVPADMGRIVVAVDPAVTNTEESDYHGIVAAGVSRDGKEAYVLDDASCKGSPMDWARRAVAMYDSWQADAIVVETNQGGDMVAHTIRSIRNTIRIREVRASRGKHVRAEPVSSMYEQGRVHHVGGFPDLEQQMTLMTNSGFEGEGSPDRVDALVWAMTDLFPQMTKREPVREIAPMQPMAMPMARGLQRRR